MLNKSNRNILRKKTMHKYCRNKAWTQIQHRYTQTESKYCTNTAWILHKHDTDSVGMRPRDKSSSATHGPQTNTAQTLCNFMRNKIFLLWKYLELIIQCLRRCHLSAVCEAQHIKLVWKDKSTRRIKNEKHSGILKRAEECAQTRRALRKSCCLNV